MVVSLFPYPLPGTLGLGSVDPLDYKWSAELQTWRHEPRWWKRIGQRGEREGSRRDLEPPSNLAEGEWSRTREKVAEAVGSE